MSLVDRVRAAHAKGQDVRVSIPGMFGTMLAKENTPPRRVPGVDTLGFTLKPHSAGKRGVMRFAVGPGHFAQKGTVLVRDPENPGHLVMHVARRREKPVANFRLLALFVAMVETEFSHSRDGGGTLDDLKRLKLLGPDLAPTKKGIRVAKRFLRELVK